MGCGSHIHTITPAMISAIEIRTQGWGNIHESRITPVWPESRNSLEWRWCFPLWALVISPVNWRNWTRVTCGFGIPWFSFPYLPQGCHQGQLFPISRKLHVSYICVPRQCATELPLHGCLQSPFSCSDPVCTFACVGQGEIWSQIQVWDISFPLSAPFLFPCFQVSFSGRSRPTPVLPTPTFPERVGFVSIQLCTPLDLSTVPCA